MTMTAQSHTLYEGAEPTLRFYCFELDEAGERVGPQDLTGASVSYRVGFPTILTKAATVSDAAGGVVDVVFDTADTTLLGGAPGDSNRYRHELWITFADGTEHPGAVGYLTVRGALHDEP